MGLPVKFWINQFSFLGFIGLVAYFPASIVGEFFGIIAKHYARPQSEVMLTSVGTVFGFSGFALCLLGALAIPGELSGLIRPYKRNDPHFAEAQVVSRNVLLITTSLLAWVALLSLSMFVFAFRQPA